MSAEKDNQLAGFSEALAGQGQSRPAPVGRADPHSRLQRHRPFLLLLLLYLVAALWLTFRLPAFAAPNEALHYEYVALFLRERRLPDPAQSMRQDERHQPPLYYALAALVSAPLPQPPLDRELPLNPFFLQTVRGNRNPLLHATPDTVPVLYAARLVSTLFGAVGVLAVYATALQTLSASSSLLIAALTAFQPMYLFLSAAANNDLAATAMSALLLAYTTRLVITQQPPRAYFFWGLLFALALLTKASTVFLLLLLPVALLARWRRQPGLHALRKSLTAGLLGLAGFVPLYGAWLLLNRLRQLDLLAIESSLPLERVLRLNPAALLSLRPHLFTLWRSFWLDWSSGEAGYSYDWVYLLWLLLLIFSLAGWLRRSRSAPTERPGSAWLFWMHLLWISPLLLIFLGVKALMLKEAGFLTPEGRWLLPALPSLAWLAGSGFTRLCPTCRRDRATRLATLLPLLSTGALLIYTIPRLYPQPERLASAAQIPATTTPSQLVYDGQVSLLATAAEPFTVDQAGAVTFYWQALRNIEQDYSLAVRLIVPEPEGWQLLDTRHTFPGRGLASTAGWEEGLILRDELLLVPNGSLNGPTAALIDVRLRHGDSELPVFQDGQPVEEASAAPAVVRPAQPLQPPSQERLSPPVHFGDNLQLIAASPTVQEGQTLLTLWWQAEAAIAQDYTVFAHLLDANGALLGQSDGPPDRGRSPTRIWQPGDVIRDQRLFPMEAPPGSSVLLGLYELSTLQRLPASRSGEPLPDAAFRLPLGTK